MDPVERRSANRVAIDEYFDLIATGDVTQLATYWHDDILFEAPFSFTGHPSQTQGKAALQERLTTSYGLVSMSFTITTVHELVDPDRFFVEYTSDGHMLGSGDRYQNIYITMVGFTDGLISTFCEYYDSQRCAAAFGPLLSDDH